MSYFTFSMGGRVGGTFRLINFDFLRPTLVPIFSMELVRLFPEFLINHGFGKNVHLIFPPPFLVRSNYGTIILNSSVRNCHPLILYTHELNNYTIELLHLLGTYGYP